MQKQAIAFIDKAFGFKKVTNQSIAGFYFMIVKI